MKLQNEKYNQQNKHFSFRVQILHLTDLIKQTYQGFKSYSHKLKSNSELPHTTQATI